MISRDKELVSLKGTRNGILVSISEECAFDEALEHLRLALTERRGFLGGSPVSIDLGWREVSEGEYSHLMRLVEELGVHLLGVISTSLATRRLFESKGIKVIIGTLGLAKHGGRRGRGGAVEPPPLAPSRAAVSPARTVEQPASTPPADLALLGGADPTMLVRRTLRSGQRVQFSGNVVVMGDVNAGAEIEAGGDVIILGSLRGKVHAGAGGKQEATVYALNQSGQIRIAHHGATTQNANKSFHSNSAVVSRLLDGLVVTALYGSS